jgi:hypothetical protein
MSHPSDKLSTDERQAIADEFRKELEVEHVDRQDAQAERESRSDARRDARNSRSSVLAEAEIKAKVRADFYKENGYKLYTDSAGRQHWLTPGEFEWRTAARARRDGRRKNYVPSIWIRQKQMMMYGSAVLLAVALGLYLVT